MSQYAPPPCQPDGRIFASYPMPAKIDLIQERPRRESLVERQLGGQLGARSLPRIEVSEQNLGNTVNQGQQTYWQTDESQQNNYSQHQQHPQHNQPTYAVWDSQQATENQPQQMVHQQQRFSGASPGSGHTVTTTTTTQVNNIRTNNNSNSASLAAELASKEAKLMADINALQQRPYSPYRVPAKIDLSNEQRAIQMQHQNAPSPRPSSRSSSAQSTNAADYLDKEAKLLKEIEEISRKPYNPQTMVVEREQWFEYPEGRPYDRHLTDSKRRVKDFCSMPSQMYADQGRHTYEDNLPISSLGRPSSSAGSIHTAIIRSPNREIDNKSPLPFAYDNFSTKGVRGNIASAGAVEPERPRPPIFPIIKRTPVQSMAR